MRTRKTAINIIVNLLGQLLNSLLSIFNRSVMASLMPSDYLGINGLFTNVFTVMSLAELGIGAAMLYVLYKPVSEHDEVKITMLMNMYRKMYRIVAVIVAALGVIMFPLLPVLVHSNTVVQHLNLIYVMYLVEAVSSYFFVYKSALLSANQDTYIIGLYYDVFTVVRYLVQMVVLYVTHDYLLYLAVQIIFGLIPNFLVSRRAERMFPFIRKDRSILPPVEERKAIYKNVRALFLHKIGDVMVYNVDNLLMSALVGLSAVGIYSNYKIIVTNVNNVVGQLFHATKNSVGNLAATEQDETHIYAIFKALNLACFLFYSYCTVAMVVLFRPFIRCFFSESYIFPISTELLIVMQFYMSGMRIVIGQFRDAKGLFWYDRYKPMAEVLVNLVLSWVLAQRWGLNGILAATVIDLILIPLWIEPYVLFKYGFAKNGKRYFLTYFRDYALFTATMVAAGWAAWKACQLVVLGGFVEFIVKGLVCTAVYGTIMLACYAWTKPFRMLIGYGLTLIKRKAKD